MHQNKSWLQLSLRSYWGLTGLADPLAEFQGEGRSGDRGMQGNEKRTWKG